MAVDAKLRRGLMVAGLAATLGAVYWASRQDAGDEADLVVPAEERRAASPRAERGTAARGGAGGELDLSRLSRDPSLDPRTDLFGPRDFTPPPPKRTAAQIAAAQVEAPVAPPPPPPPVPFTYLGRLAEGPRTTVFLGLADRNLVVTTGDVIDNTYRVEEIGPSTLVLTYLPRNLRQTMPIGAPK